MVYFIPSGLSLAVEVKNHARAFFKHALEDWKIFQKTVVFRKWDMKQKNKENFQEICE